MTPLAVDNACDAIREELRKIQGPRLMTWPQEREVVRQSMTEIMRQAARVTVALEIEDAKTRRDKGEPL